jgi:multisubunit Na+/H+ antiporter MnhB subunit
VTERVSLRRLQVRHWILVVVAAGVAALAGAPGVGGVLIGGAVMGVTVLLYAVAFGMLTDPKRRRLAIGVLFVKLAAFLGLGWVVLGSGIELTPDPLGFAAGLTCFPAAAVWEAMRARGS